MLPDPEKEKGRYESHNNDIYDERYQAFVSPVVESVLQDFTEGEKGLDFGAGPGPVISKLLQDKNYDIVQYDPYFYNDSTLLEKKYHYIVCCEVIEHFYTPQKDFELLKKLLLPGGKLYCMTQLYGEGIDFGRWHYKNDNTHVFFYQKETMLYIKNQFDFNHVRFSGRLIVFGH